MEETLFAELDENGNVLRTIVIEEKVLKLGLWGDPSRFIRVDRSLSSYSSADRELEWWEKQSISGFAASPSTVVGAMLDIAKLKPGDKLYDLGSGDGAIIIEAAKRGAIAIGIEINPRLVEKSIKSAEEAGVSIEVRHEDFLDSDFSDADVITLYVGDGPNEQLRDKGFPKNSRIVSNNYPIRGIEPVKTIVVGDSTLYLYYG